MLEFSSQSAPKTGAGNWRPETDSENRMRIAFVDRLLNDRVFRENWQKEQQRKHCELNSRAQQSQLLSHALTRLKVLKGSKQGHASFRCEPSSARQQQQQQQLVG